MLDPQTELTLSVTPEARAELEAQGVTDVPSEVCICHRPATMREHEWYEQQQSNQHQQIEFVASLLHRRVVTPIGIDGCILVEICRDMTPTELVQHHSAFIHGELPDPKKIQTALSTTTNGMLSRVLDALAKEPSSHGFLD